MRRLFISGAIAALIGVVTFWWLTIPSGTNNSGLTLPSHEPGDPTKGELVFWASGCASCHAAKDAKGDEKLLLGGGHRLKTPFGTFVTPNISPDKETGIGTWNTWQFHDAMTRGIYVKVADRESSKHYFPSFPYASYNKMKDDDVFHLFAYLKTLPPVSRPNEPHDLPVIFQWRRPLGIWKLLFTDDAPSVSVPEGLQILKRGQYLVEALGHCGECHTPRNLLGGSKKSLWLAGGPSPEGEGRIPNITPHENGIGGWSKEDIVYYLETGFTPGFDSAGGSMASVVENMAKLPKSDLEAIAEYLKAVPATAGD